MPAAGRSTRIVHGRLALRAARLEAAREARHGLKVMTFEQAAIRLAGGFAQAIDTETLRAIIQAVLPAIDMGELERIKLLPGMVTAAADSLHKVWHAGVDAALWTPRHPRLESIARLEAAVLERLPHGMRRPADIVAAATARLIHAPAILGAIEISGLTELEPCWRPLLRALATVVPVQWTAGPRAVPDWLTGSAIKIVTRAAEVPRIRLVCAATAYHEALESLRWARALLASGVSSSDIAIASAATADYDDHFLALRADADFDLRFAHGIRTVATGDGQAAAALADLIVRGLSHARVRRLAVLCGNAEPLRTLPKGWLRVLPHDAPLASLAAWERLLTRLTPEDWPDGQDHSSVLRTAVHALAQGPRAAQRLGEAFLESRALAIWRKALLAGPPAAIDATLESLKHDDGPEACVSVAWMPASALAASPRRFVRLVGLNSSHWPRAIAADRLIPDHVVATHQIDPLPVNQADRRDFRTILATTAQEIVLSRARRDSEGRLLGRSPLLLAEYGEEVYQPRHATPPHAFSETDRLTARPAEFALEPQAVSAVRCWRDWHRRELTAHDGLVRADHPLLRDVLNRRHSASSLQSLLRNPLGFLWRYALHWKAPQLSADPLVLNPLELGDLVHRALDEALQELAGAGGLADAEIDEITVAVRNAMDRVVLDWESQRAIPPNVIWHKTLDDVRETAVKALAFESDAIPGARSYSEVPFGGIEPKARTAFPWDVTMPVVVPGTTFRIGGYIDRLDIASDCTQARVIDYKTGNPPKKPFRLRGGSELQRCLYAFAVKALLGEHVAISAALLYPRTDLAIPLEDPDAAMAEVSAYLRAAGTSFASGASIPGPDTAGPFDDLRFALPANASAGYCKRKQPVILARLADLAPLWQAE